MFSRFSQAMCGITDWCLAFAAGFKTSRLISEFVGVAAHFRQSLPSASCRVCCQKVVLSLGELAVRFLDASPRGPPPYHELNVVPCPRSLGPCPDGLFLLL